MKHYIKKCKKDSWRIQNVIIYIELHKNVQKFTKMHIDMFKKLNDRHH
jgi:hypothetical protein